jgi:hypothetical protein
MNKPIDKFRVGDILEFIDTSSTANKYRKVIKIKNPDEYCIMEYFWDKECTKYAGTSGSNLPKFYIFIRSSICKYRSKNV